MSLAAQGATKPRWKRVLAGPLSLADDLGAVGETVRPRAGHGRRTAGEREDWCLRRYLIALAASGRLPTPLTVEAAGPGMRPDFVLRGPGGTTGLEITEATSPEEQARWSREDATARGSGFEETEIELVGDRGSWAGDAPERAIADLIVAAVKRKLDGFDHRYGHLPSCDLLVYVNTEIGIVASVGKPGEGLRIASDALRRSSPPGRRAFRQVHVLSGKEVWLDLAGPHQQSVEIGNRYEADLAAWALDQGEKAIAGRAVDLDLPNIGEELLAMGRSERGAVASHLRVLMQHLLKWEYQPVKLSKSWRQSIVNARRAIEDRIAASPSLGAMLDDGELLGREYGRAAEDAAAETGLPGDTFPSKCPFSRAELLSDGFPADLRVAAGAARQAGARGRKR